MTATVRTFHGQRYELVGTFPRARKDGGIATINVWQSACVECGSLFEFSTPAASSKFEPNRRCQRHKRPGVRVKK